MKSLIPARSSSSCSCSTPPPLWPSAGRPPPPHSGPDPPRHTADRDLRRHGHRRARGRHRPPAAPRGPGLTPGSRQTRKARVPMPTMKSAQTAGRARSRWPRSTARFPGPGTCWCGYAPAASAAPARPSCRWEACCWARKGRRPRSCLGTSRPRRHHARQLSWAVRVTAARSATAELRQASAGLVVRFVEGVADALVGGPGLAVDAVGVDREQDGDAVAGAAGDLGGGHPGVQP
jgi:hypothetical protein